MSKLLSIVLIVLFLHSSLLECSKGKAHVDVYKEHKDLNESRDSKTMSKDQVKTLGRPSSLDMKRIANLEVINKKVPQSESLVPPHSESMQPVGGWPEQKGVARAPEVLDLTGLRTNQPAVTRKPYIMLDPYKVEKSHPVQRFEKGVPVQFNEKMNTSIHDYIEALKSSSRYTNLVKIAPEIFATYAIEFITKKSGNSTFLGVFSGVIYNPISLMEAKSFTKWFDTIDRETNFYNNDSSLPNLYMGMQFLEDMDVSQNYTTAARSGNNWMTADMDFYVEALRSQYAHVPDIILESYVTAYLKDPMNQKYVQREEVGKSPIAKIVSYLGKKTLVNADQLIPITPEALLAATKGERLEGELFSGLEMPPQFEGKFDVRSLQDYQKLYLTMQAIENINKIYPEEYTTMVVENGLQIHDQKTFLDKKTVAIASPGSFESFLLRFNIGRKNFSKPATWNTNGSLQVLENNYPSYQEFMHNKYDVAAFEQLQIDFINLSQDILVVQERLVRSPDQKLKSFVDVAIQLKNSMNAAIIDHQVQDFMETSLSSENKEILLDDSFNFLNQLVSKEGGSNPSEIQKILNEQKAQVDNKIRPILQVAFQKIAALKPENLQLDLLPDLIKNKKEGDLARAETNLNRSKIPENEQIYYVEKIVVDQLEVLLKIRTRERDRIESLAAPIVEYILSIDTSPQARQNIIEQSLQEFKTIIDQNKQEPGHLAIKKAIDALIPEYHNKDFELQDIGKITEKLEELIKQYDNEGLKIYNQVFIELHTKLAPDQLAKQQQIKFDTQVKVYIDNALAKGTSLAAIIKEVEKKIADLDKRLAANGNLLPTDRADLNKGLKKVDNSTPEELTRFSTFEIGSNEQIIQIYRDILKELKNRQQQERENSAGYQVRQNMYNGLENLWHRDFSQGGSHVGDAVGHIPGAVGEVNAVLTSYVDGVLGSMKNNLGAVTLAGIASVIAAVSPILIQINQSNASDDQKKKMQDEVLMAMMGDIGNLVIADRTGVSVDVVAGRDAQAIATSSLFNKAINLLVPNDPNAGFSYNSAVTSPAYVSNVSRFQTQYNPVLTNQYPIQSTNQYPNQIQSNNGYSTHSVPIYGSNSYTPYNSYNAYTPVFAS